MTTYLIGRGKYAIHDIPSRLPHDKQLIAVSVSGKAPVAHLVLTFTSSSNHLRY